MDPEKGQILWWFWTYVKQNKKQLGILGIVLQSVELSGVDKWWNGKLRDLFIFQNINALVKTWGLLHISGVC